QAIRFGRTGRSKKHQHKTESTHAFPLLVCQSADHSVEFVKQSRPFPGTLRDNAPVRPHADGREIIGAMGSFVCDGNHICDAGTVTSCARVTTSVLRGTAQNRSKSESGLSKAAARRFSTNGLTFGSAVVMLNDFRSFRVPPTARRAWDGG